MSFYKDIAFFRYLDENMQNGERHEKLFINLEMFDNDKVYIVNLDRCFGVVTISRRGTGSDNGIIIFAKFCRA